VNELVIGALAQQGKFPVETSHNHVSSKRLCSF